MGQGRFRLFAIVVVLLLAVLGVGLALAGGHDCKGIGFNDEASVAIDPGTLAAATSIEICLSTSCGTAVKTGETWGPDAGRGALVDAGQVSLFFPLHTMPTSPSDIHVVIRGANPADVHAVIRSGTSEPAGKGCGRNHVFRAALRDGVLVQA